MARNVLKIGGLEPVPSVPEAREYQSYRAIPDSIDWACARRIGRVVFHLAGIARLN